MCVFPNRISYQYLNVSLTSDIVNHNSIDEFPAVPTVTSNPQQIIMNSNCTSEEENWRCLHVHVSV